MAISLVGTASSATASAAATHTPPTVAGVVPGDLIIAVSTASLATLPVWSASSYAGWTLLEDLAEPSMLTRILYRIADGTAADTPPAMATNATSNRVSSTAVYRGVDVTSPFIAEAGQVHSTASSVSHPAPAITNTNPGAWAVFSGTARQVATPLTWTAPAGLVERQDRDNALATTNNAAITWADSNGPVAASTVTYTGTTSAATAQAIAWAAFLNPATGITVTPSGAVGQAPSPTSPTVTMGSVGPAPSVATLTDDFATADSAKWFGYDTYTQVSGGQLVQALTSTYDAGLVSQQVYSLVGSSAAVQLVQRPNIGNGTTEAIFSLELDTNNWLRWFITGPNLLALRRVAGTTTSVATVPYNAATHQRLRIRESGGTIFWDTYDGSTWTQRGSWVISGLAVTAMKAVFVAGYWGGTEPNPGTVIWDNFNIMAPSAITVTPSTVGAAPTSAAPTVTLGPPMVSPSGPVGSAPTPRAPTVTPGPITVRPTTAAAPPSLASPTVVGKLTVSPGLATYPGVALAPTVTGRLSVTPDTVGDPALAWNPRIRGDEIVFVATEQDWLPRRPKVWNGSAWVVAPVHVLD